MLTHSEAALTFILNHTDRQHDNTPSFLIGVNSPSIQPQQGCSIRSPIQLYPDSIKLVCNASGCSVPLFSQGTLAVTNFVALILRFYLM